MFCLLLMLYIENMFPSLFTVTVVVDVKTSETDVYCNDMVLLLLLLCCAQDGKNRQ